MSIPGRIYHLQLQEENVDLLESWVKGISNWRDYFLFQREVERKKLADEQKEARKSNIYTKEVFQTI